MKRLLKITAFFLFFCSANSFAAKNVVVIATGGTIAGAGESQTSSGYQPSKVGIEEIIKSIPGIDKIANVKAEQLMQVASQDMDSKTWLEIAKKVNEVLAQNNVNGVVITHGTDTIEETAYFLNLVVKSKKPVVLVGAMRPSTSLSADGSLNLFNAVAVAASDSSVNKGVMLVFNDEIHSAREVFKTHTTNVAAFKSSNTGIIGSAYFGDVKFYLDPIRAHTHETIFDVKRFDNLPKVGIVYAHSGFDSKIIDYLADHGYKGIVLAGVGDGNINQQSVDALAEAVRKGLVVVRSAHLGAGSVQPNVEINDEDFGFVTADNLSPKKARILTMLAITKTEDPRKIREMFAKY